MYTHASCDHEIIKSIKVKSRKLIPHNYHNFLTQSQIVQAHLFLTTTRIFSKYDGPGYKGYSHFLYYSDHNDTNTLEPVATIQKRFQNRNILKHFKTKRNLSNNI